MGLFNLSRVMVNVAGLACVGVGVYKLLSSDKKRDTNNDCKTPNNTPTKGAAMPIHGCGKRYDNNRAMYLSMLVFGSTALAINNISFLEKQIVSFSCYLGRCISSTQSSGFER